MKPRYNDMEMLGFGPAPFRLWRIMYVTRDREGNRCHDMYPNKEFFRVGTYDRCFFAASLVCRFRDSTGRRR